MPGKTRLGRIESAVALRRLGWQIVIEAVAVAFHGDELRLVMRCAPTIANDFRARGPVGVASTKNAYDF